MRALSLLALFVPALAVAGQCPVSEEITLDAFVADTIAHEMGHNFDAATIAHEMGHNLGMVVAIPVSDAGWPAPVSTFWYPEIDDEVLAAVWYGDIVLVADLEADGCPDQILYSPDADYDPLAFDALDAAARWSFVVEISGVAAGY